MVQVKRLTLTPDSGPVLMSQFEATSLIVQLTVPAGAVAPTTPLTVAVKVMVPPKSGLKGEVVIVMSGVALLTRTEAALVVAEE